jgi:hypothetical protein
VIQEPTSLTPAPSGLEPSPERPRLGPTSRNAGWFVVVAIALLVAAALVAMALTSSSPSTQSSPVGASAAPLASAGITNEADGIKSGRGHLFDLKKGWGKLRGPGFGRGQITITAIAGASVDLATDDGWTRTIAITADTAILKGGQTITAADLAVGDEIRLKQSRNDDGTYEITAIVVSTPKVAGEVTAVSGSNITLKKRDASTQVITVDSSTIYKLGSSAGSKSDIVVGSRIFASGTVSGSTFTALSVYIEPARAAGVVTAKTDATITIQGRGDTTTVIHVTDSTIFKVWGVDKATLDDIKVGDRLGAEGTRRANGSIDATGVLSGPAAGRGHGAGPKEWAKPDKDKGSPTTSATPG